MARKNFLDKHFAVFPEKKTGGYDICFTILFKFLFQKRKKYVIIYS